MDNRNKISILLVIIGLVLVFSSDSIGHILLQNSYPDGIGNPELVSLFSFSLGSIVIGGSCFFIGLNNLLKK